MKFSGVVLSTLSALAVFFGSTSCVNVNESLGLDYLAIDQQYDIYTTSFRLDDVQMQHPDSLTAYNTYRFTVGAVRDEIFGLTTRSAAFTLVPINDTLDFGKPGTQKFQSFHFAGAPEKISCADESQEDILQNINVYELKEAFDTKDAYPTYCLPDPGHRKRITDGVPVYNGKDSLSFNFTEEFAKKYMTIQDHDLDSIATYVERFPGIWITCDEPVGIGGRINMFKLPIALDDGYITGSYASLKFQAEYDERGPIDTSFLFYLGPVAKHKLAGVMTTNEMQFPQIAFEMSDHEKKIQEGPVTDKFYLEGGRGLKPVVKAEQIREKLIAEIVKHGDPSKVVICKATMHLPYFYSSDKYKEVDYYPAAVSPTCRIVDDKSIKFISITDSSVEGENQGTINRSLNQYSPDMSYHVQELLDLKDMKKIENYDIWYLAMSAEVVSKENANANNDYMNEMMENMAYASYYDGMYGGYGGYGYGGYGGFGGYGYDGYGGYGGYGGYYNNYYNYMMLQQMYASQNQQQKITKLMMDPDKYYRAVFKGPADENGPSMTITYALPKKFEE